jgi:hypothetical protein
MPKWRGLARLLEKRRVSEKQGRFSRAAEIPRFCGEAALLGEAWRFSRTTLSMGMGASLRDFASVRGGF